MGFADFKFRLDLYQTAHRAPNGTERAPRSMWIRYVFDLPNRFSWPEPSTEQKSGRAFLP